MASSLVRKEQRITKKHVASASSEHYSILASLSLVLTRHNASSLRQNTKSSDREKCEIVTRTASDHSHIEKISVFLRMKKWNKNMPSGIP